MVHGRSRVWDRGDGFVGHDSQYDRLQYAETGTCGATSAHSGGEYDKIDYLETECRLFPPVTKFLDLFLCAGYFFNALY